MLELNLSVGLYVGAFAPCGTEIVKLRHNYVNWNDVNDDDESSDVYLFEYVKAVKLTGDLNLPAGQVIHLLILLVTFRAKNGKGIYVSKRGLYLDELGVSLDVLSPPYVDMTADLPEDPDIIQDHYPPPSYAFMNMMSPSLNTRESTIGLQNEECADGDEEKAGI
ncbi:hypothetical protein LguiA_027959 [Lonicera macranthoides]